MYEVGSSTQGSISKGKYISKSKYLSENDLLVSDQKLVGVVSKCPSGTIVTIDMSYLTLLVLSVMFKAPIHIQNGLVTILRLFVCSRFEDY